MCVPAVPLMIAATAVGTLGSVVSGVNQANSYRYQAKMQDRNAALDRNAAQDALARGRVEEERQGRRTQQLVGQQRAAMAANGIEVDFGSAASLQDDTRMIGFEDAQTIRENAARESKGYEIRAWNSRAGASANRSNASGALWATAFDAGSKLLAGAQSYRKMQAPFNASASGAGQGGSFGWGNSGRFPGPPGMGGY